MSRQFHPSVLLPEREPVFGNRYVPTWVVMLAVAAIGFVCGMAFLAIAESMAP